MSKRGGATATERVHMVVEPSFLKKVDNWRRQQPDIPNRTQAIKRLALAAIEAEKKAPEMTAS